LYVDKGASPKKNQEAASRPGNLKKSLKKRGWFFRRTKWPLSSSCRPVLVVCRKGDALLYRPATEEATGCSNIRGGSVVNRVLYVLVVLFLLEPNEDRLAFIIPEFFHFSSPPRPV